VGQFSNTPDDHVMLFRCGHARAAGCGKILTEGQLERSGECTRCGSLYFSPFYPKTKWQTIKCYALLIRTGEAWVRKQKTKESSPQTS